MLAQRPNPIEASLKLAGGDPEIAEELVKRAQNEMRSRREASRVKYNVGMRWLDTDEGMIYAAWLCLRRSHPVKLEHLEDVQALFQRASNDERQEFLRRRSIVSGLDITAVADWPAIPEHTGKMPTWTPWKQWIRDWISEGIYRHLDEIASLTIQQVRLLRSPREHLGGAMRMSRAEASEKGYLPK